MSAIAGIVSFHGALQDPEWVEHLTSAMVHRGPDATGHWRHGSVSLGHCMLRTTPQTRPDKQPLVDPESGIALVLDGRLDNRAELLGKLRGSLSLDASPDSEFLLASYKQWGEDCPKYLLGDFAFAIWDPAQKKLFCARDPVGAGGLSFYHGEGIFAFATESEALLRLPAVKPAPNENYIALVLVPEFENDGDRASWLREVQVLRHGESLVIAADGNIHIRRYWEPEPQETRRYASYAESEEHFLSVFGQAVRDRMQGPGDVAIMMSGGLDSAGTAAMTHRLLPEFPGKQIQAYSAISDDTESCIESQCIQSLAGGLGLVLNTVSVPSFRGMVTSDDLLETALRQAHPVSNSILLPALMCRAASRDGHKVILHGAGGDMAMKAPRYYFHQSLRQGRWLTSWCESRAASKHNYYLQGQPPLSILLRGALRALAPAALMRWRRSKRFSTENISLQSSVINPEFARRIHLEEKLQDEFCRRQLAMGDAARKIQLENRVAMICSGLSGFNSVAGRCGVEARDPWSDIRVLDFFSRLPDHYKVRDGWTKFPVRSAFREELPQLVRQRLDKQHLGWKFTLRLMGESSGWRSSRLQEDLDEIAEYVDINKVKRVNEQFEQRNDFASRQKIFELQTLIFWLRRINAL